MSMQPPPVPPPPHNPHNPRQAYGARGPYGAQAPHRPQPPYAAPRPHAVPPQPYGRAPHPVQPPPYARQAPPNYRSGYPPQAPYARAPYPPRPYPVPPRKGLSGGAITAIVLSVCLVLGVMLSVPVLFLAGVSDGRTEAGSGWDTDSGWDSDSGWDDEAEEGPATSAPGPTPTPTNTYAYEDPSSFDEFNAWASTFQAYIGSDGTYRDAMEELAERYGVRVEWDFEKRQCPANTDPGTYIIAMVCAGGDGTIYFNTEMPDFADYVRSLEAIDTIKHELSHLQIAEICGISSPPVTDATGHEAVASSYAVLFLGMDRARHDSDARDKYVTTAASDSAARSIKNGDCG